MLLNKSGTTAIVQLYLITGGSKILCYTVAGIHLHWLTENAADGSQMQTCQVSRIRHETHAFEVYLTLSRIRLKPHAFTPHLKFHFFC